MGRTKDLFIEEYQRIEHQVQQLRSGGRLGPHMLGNSEAMEQAVEASRHCVQEPNKEKPTPKVGAAIVKAGKILGVAYRGELKPGEHAEYTLLERKLKDVDVTGATIYTTLEPCTKRGPNKTECTKWIIDRGIAEVVIGSLDWNPDVCGIGELRLRKANVKIARFPHKYMIEIEALNEEFSQQFPLDAKLQRTASEKTDPVEPGELFGPNGFPIGYDGEGNKVEWLPDEENPGKTWPMILRRNDNSIFDMYNELWDKVWWNRHMYSQHRHEKKLISCAGREGIGCEAAARIEKKYGKKNLGWDDIDWGLLQGKMSALAWVMGSEWEGSLDT